jgi:hypothetical protein
MTRLSLPRWLVPRTFRSGGSQIERNVDFDIVVVDYDFSPRDGVQPHRRVAQPSTPWSGF